MRDGQAPINHQLEKWHFHLMDQMPVIEENRAKDMDCFHRMKPRLSRSDDHKSDQQRYNVHKARLARESFALMNRFVPFYYHVAWNSRSISRGICCAPFVVVTGRSFC
jgi:hypothetical protein